jgi:KDEL-tailed cysteine endopeptidase
LSFSLLLWPFFITGSSSIKETEYILKSSIQSPIDENDDWIHFTQFQQRFSKKYADIDEMKHRFQIFSDNFRHITLHNQDRQRNFSMSVNQFADLTQSEFQILYVGSIKPTLGSYGCKPFTGNGAGTPESIDWRQKGAVTEVKDQGICGSCWTFSGTGAIEGVWSISKGQLLDLSEQQLVDCATGLAYGSYGCSGGQINGAFRYVAQYGQCALTDYPYTAKDGTCQKCNSVVSISGCADVETNNQLALKSAVSKQPVSVAIEADTRYFQFYSGGILTSSSCGTDLDHGVLVVGYGVENSQKYWLVKNSWGTSWGENGYIRIARTDSTNDPGICGVAMDPSFPVVGELRSP